MDVVVAGRRLPWTELGRFTDDGGAPAVVLLPGEDADRVLAVLDAAGGAVAVATAVPMTDTLKLVDDDGTVLGTADREHHRLVGTPIAAPLDALRAARTAGTPLQLLALLAARMDVVPAGE